MREASIGYLLLCGGEKSTQKTDILLALKMAKQLQQAAKDALMQTTEPNGYERARSPTTQKAKRRKDDA